VPEGRPNNSPPVDPRSGARRNPGSASRGAPAPARRDEPKGDGIMAEALKNALRPR
jgi:hypothetical protein